MKVIFRTADGLEAIVDLSVEKLPRVIRRVLIAPAPIGQWWHECETKLPDNETLSARDYVLTKEGQDNFVYVEKA